VKIDTIENLLFCPSFEAAIETEAINTKYCTLKNNSFKEFNIHNFSRQNPLGFFGKFFSD